jgi:hypothetical protein
MKQMLLSLKEEISLILQPLASEILGREQET